MLTINFLPYNRQHFMELTIREICKISPKLKCLLTVAIHKDTNLNVDGSLKLLNEATIQTIVYNYPSHEYLPKIKNICNVTTDEFSMKIDEDIFLTSYVFEYILTHLSILNQHNLILTPVLSTGIPTVERFIDDVFDDEDKKTMYKIFNQTHIDNHWGADYTSLNQDKTTEWNPDNYYDKISKLFAYYKGIHPIRINSHAQNTMKEMIRKYKNKIISKQEYWIETTKISYMCNSCFVIKTELWKKAIFDDNLYRDPYDEVPLNLYMGLNNYNICFIRNANGIHPSYNTVHDYMSIANQIYEILK